MSLMKSRKKSTFRNSNKRENNFFGMPILPNIFVFKNRKTDWSGSRTSMKFMFMEFGLGLTLLFCVYSSLGSVESQVLVLLLKNLKDYDLTNKGLENL